MISVRKYRPDERPERDRRGEMGETGETRGREEIWEKQERREEERRDCFWQGMHKYLLSGESPIQQHRRLNSCTCNKRKCGRQASDVKGRREAERDGWWVALLPVLYPSPAPAAVRRR